MPITLKNDGNLEAQGAPPALRPDVKQRRRMLLALAVLLIAVVIVFVKDRELWFAASPGPDSETANPGVAASTPGPPPSLPAVETVTPSPTASAAKKRPTPRLAPHPDNTSAAPMISATDRAVLPPLEVEVVAGNQRQALAASNSSVKVEMQPATGAAQASAVPRRASAPMPT